MDFSLVFESGFVAVYCAVLFAVFTLFIQNPYALLFVFGFAKHLLGAYLGMQDYYCNHGYACKSLDSTNYIYRKDSILMESVLEGLWFLVFGSLAFYFAKTFGGKVTAMFVLGFATHVVSEMIGLHHYICENRCVG